MVEPTCIIHPFPAFSNDPIHQENNPMTTFSMGESVSFGRYMTENLEWERWSTFEDNNRNRYVEEAKTYSRPGSVAQKKAYFEAHFKRMAALKAAALLEEQANSINNSAAAQAQIFPEYNSNDIDSNVVVSSVNEEIIAEKDGQSEKVEGYVVHENELYSSVAGNDDQMAASGGDDVEGFDVEKGGSKDEFLKDSVNDEDGVDDFGEGVEHSHHHVDEDGELLKQSEVCLDGEKRDVSSNGSNVDSCGVSQMDKPPLQKDKLKEGGSVAIVKKNPPLSSYMSPMKGISREPLFASSPAYAAGVHPGKENYVTPMKKKSTSNDPEKKRTPLRATINREFNRIMSPVIRKIGSSKASKDCSTPSKNTGKASVNGSVQSPTMTPDQARRGSRSLQDSFAREGKLPGPRWHILSDGYKSPVNSRNKISSPIIPSSFCLSSRERASKRKQKLEEKFNATASERAPQSSKFKEKAEAELNKFRHSFCFKVMSSPDHYGESQTQNASLQSPKRGRQCTASSSQSKSSLPPRRPAVKVSNSRK